MWKLTIILIVGFLAFGGIGWAELPPSKEFSPVERLTILSNDCLPASFGYVPEGFYISSVSMLRGTPGYEVTFLNRNAEASFVVVIQKCRYLDGLEKNSSLVAHRSTGWVRLDANYYCKVLSGIPVMRSKTECLTLAEMQRTAISVRVSV